MSSDTEFAKLCRISKSHVHFQEENIRYALAKWAIKQERGRLESGENRGSNTRKLEWRTAIPKARKQSAQAKTVRVRSPKHQIY